jgi:subtilisin family serine protease
MKRKIGWFIALIALVSAAVVMPANTPTSVAATPSPAGDKIAPELQAQMAVSAPGEMVTAIVTMRDQADLSSIPGADRAARQQGVIRALQAQAAASQRQIQAFLRAQQAQGRVGDTTSFWVFNGLSVTAVPEVFQELAARDDVAKITPDAIQLEMAPLQADAATETNLSVIDAPALWGLGYSGQGVVVASMDSGVDISHPELAARWRGGGNSWYDPYGQHPATPTDLSGHGTWTTGVMVAGDAGGTAIGVAPGAQWIAVKIFDDRGRSRATAIHSGFQWLMDPDGSPATADAPDVVNNSWTFSGPGCNLEFELDMEALRAIGVLPVFAAGNFGPYAATSASPANNPAAFAVGATDNADQIYAYSSRGPSACGETQTIYPEIVAPGVNIKTTDRYGFYTYESGTSLAAPHASGALALLLSAYPGLSTSQQEAALLGSGADLGAAGPDNDFGYGRLNVLAAYQWLQGGADPTPTPTPDTPTPTPAPPTPTPTSEPPTPTPEPPTPTPQPTALPSALHAGDLDGSSASAKGSWTAAVAIEVHDSSHSPVSGVTVTGEWSGGYSGTSTCTTDGSGRCQVSTGGISKKQGTVMFSVSDAARAGYTYNASSNHDPDGDSNGTAISIIKP